MSSGANKVYLPNLNSVRAIAAIMVLIAHIEVQKDNIHLYYIKALIPMGEIGVTIFFTLSGFLITYLLLLEKERFQKVDIKSFYVRRILRIWPLFYFVLLFGYWIAPVFIAEYYPISDLGRHSFLGIGLNMLFLTNVTFIYKLTPLFIHTIWSIGVEEQFYIFWPWLSMKRNELFKRAIFFIILLIPALKISFLILTKVLHLAFLEDVYHVICVSKFDAMASGGLFALLYFEKVLVIGKVKLTYDLFCTKNMQMLAYIGVFAYILAEMLIDERLGHLYPIFAICTGIVLMNLSTNKNTIVNIENKILSSLGQVSYGIYLLHLPILLLFYDMSTKLFPLGNYTHYNLIIYPVVCTAVIGLSYISYYFYESKFLKLKGRFSKIIT